MKDSVFLTRIVLTNYKSIKACSVKLGPLNFLVGPNGAGKSNFLDALRLVAEALNTSLDHALRDRGGSTRSAADRPAIRRISGFVLSLSFRANRRDSMPSASPPRRRADSRFSKKSVIFTAALSRKPFLKWLPVTSSNPISQSCRRHRVTAFTLLPLPACPIFVLSMTPCRGWGFTI